MPRPGALRHRQRGWARRDSPLQGRGSCLRGQQPRHSILDRFAFGGFAEPFAELAAGDGDGDAVAFLAEPG